MMENTDHRSTGEVQCKQEKAPVGEVDEPFLVSIGVMEATGNDPTQAVPGEYSTIYSD